MGWPGIRDLNKVEETDLLTMLSSIVSGYNICPVFLSNEDVCFYYDGVL